MNVKVALRPQTRAGKVFQFITGALLISVLIGVLSGCAGFGNAYKNFEAAWKGRVATITTYTQQGDLIDEYSGTSIRVSRDEMFDSADASTGESNKDSAVLLISIGDNHVSHVGSTLIVAERGLEPIAGGTSTVRFTSSAPGTPWLNDLKYKLGNQMRGASRLVVIRSQNGNPIAVYAGNHVEVFPTDVKKSTQFRVDGKMLFVYRADYTVPDVALLSQP